MTVEDFVKRVMTDDPVTGDDLRAKVVYLAALDMADYLVCKKAEAKELGISAADLDRAVRDVRAKNGGPRGQGRPVDISPPEPWGESVDGEPLANEMRDTISRYVLLPDGGAEVVTLWILHTHVFGAWRVSPRLFITSPEKGCGKSTLLNGVLGKMVCKPLRAANLTAPVIFRVIEDVQPCLLIDEADSFLRDNDDMRGILNSSHNRDDAHVLRLVPVGDDYEAREFSTWAPMAIAGIGRIADTLEDRSIKISMCRRLPAERLADIGDPAEKAFAILARKAARWCEGKEGVLASNRPEIPHGVINRLADNWRPLLAVADAIGGEWSEAARAALKASVAAQEDGSDSVRVVVLADIQTIFNSCSTDRLSSEQIVDDLGDMEDRPWPEWRNGKPITKAALARLLKPFFIFPRTVKFDSGTTAKGYHLHQFNEAISRYVDPGKDANGGDTHTQTVTPSLINDNNGLQHNQTVTAENEVTVSKSGNTLKNNDSDGVTVCKGEGSQYSSNHPENDTSDWPETKI